MYSLNPEGNGAFVHPHVDKRIILNIKQLGCGMD
jgi:hypothetical protein